MSAKNAILISQAGAICAAGSDIGEILAALGSGKCALKKSTNSNYILGQISNSALANLPQNTPHSENTRTNAILYTAALQIEHLINAAKSVCGAENIGVVIGTTTTGVEEHYKELCAVADSIKDSMQDSIESKKDSIESKQNAAQDSIESKKDSIESKRQNAAQMELLRKTYIENRSSLSNPAEFLARVFELKGVCFGLSNACTSGLKAISSAVNLIKSGLCSCVLCGGVDSINTLTNCGFASLDILSNEITAPFSENRAGINIGEGGAVFLVCKEEYAQKIISFLENKKDSMKITKKDSKKTAQFAKILGFASNNDAFAITKPSPNIIAQSALLKDCFKSAKISPQELDYINLHGTGTLANDEMEASLLKANNLQKISASSTKGAMGHTLGAAGAIESAICVGLILDSMQCDIHTDSNKSNDNMNKAVPLPLNCGTKQIDPKMPPFNLILKPTKKAVKTALCVNFAFGGDNAAMIFGNIFL